MIYPKIEEIKRKREEAGLTKYGLAQKAGLPTNAIYRIESGSNDRIHPIRAKAIAEALGCSLDDVFVCK